MPTGFADSDENPSSEGSDVPVNPSIESTDPATDESVSPQKAASSSDEPAASEPAIVPTDDDCCAQNLVLVPYDPANDPPLPSELHLGRITLMIGDPTFVQAMRWGMVDARQSYAEGKVTLGTLLRDFMATIKDDFDASGEYLSYAWRFGFIFGQICLLLNPDLGKANGQLSLPEAFSRKQQTLYHGKGLCLLPILHELAGIARAEEGAASADPAPDKG